MSISYEALTERGVSLTLGTQAGLLPYTDLAVEEFDLIHQAVGAPLDSLGQEWSKELSVSIGTGIIYKVSHQHKEERVDIFLSAPHGFFGFPLQIKVVKSHEPEGKHEHQDECPYSYEEWPVDENGESFWAIDNSGVYNEETDSWIVAEKARVYEPECYCDYVQDEVWELELSGKDGSDSLDPLAQYLGVEIEKEGENV